MKDSLIARSAEAIRELKTENERLAASVQYLEKRLAQAHDEVDRLRLKVGRLQRTHGIRRKR